MPVADLDEGATHTTSTTTDQATPGSPIADDGVTHKTSTTDQATTPASPIADDGATHKTSTTDQATPGSPLPETTVSNSDSSTLTSQAAGGG